MYLADNNFWKNLSLAIVFFTLAPVALGLSIFTLVTLNNSQEKPKPQQLAEAPQYTQTSRQIPSGISLFAAIPNDATVIKTEIEAADARAHIIRNYMLRYDSPLAPWAEKIVETADKYALDFRLITAIAQQESNLCKRIPPGTFNCWGWGIHSRGTLGFSSFDEGIETVSQGLREKYIDMGYTTPNEIMTKYTPSSPGTWARGVNMFIEEMQ